MKNNYPRTLTITMTANATGTTRTFEEIVKNAKAEVKLSNSLAAMEPNFTAVITG